MGDSSLESQVELTDVRAVALDFFLKIFENHFTI